MRVIKTQNNGRILEGDTSYLKFKIVDGVVEVWEPKTPRPPQRINTNFDPEQEKRRLKQGGCCGQPSEA